MTSFVGIIVGFAIIGFGAGLAMTLSTDAVVSAAPRDRAGAASSIAETAYELGAALGTGRPVQRAPDSSGRCTVDAGEFSQRPVPRGCDGVRL